MNWHEYDAALFDLDGVLTPTAELHMRAWQQLFVDFLTKRGIDQPYVESDYFNYIDGKPRYDGIRAFLASRSVQLAEGDPSDSPQVETVCGLANRKNEFFIALLREEGVRPYAGSLQLLDHLAERGTKVAVVTSSRNASAVLDAADLRPRFVSSSMAMSPRRRASEVSRPPTPSLTPRTNSAYQSSAPRSSKMQSPESRQAMPAASAWSSGSTVVSARSG